MVRQYNSIESINDKKPLKTTRLIQKEKRELEKFSATNPPINTFKNVIEIPKLNHPAQSRHHKKRARNGIYD
jgi:hypothetical protein